MKWEADQEDDKSMVMAKSESSKCVILQAILVTYQLFNRIILEHIKLVEDLQVVEFEKEA